MLNEEKNGVVYKQTVSKVEEAEANEFDESEANDPFQKIMERVGNHGRFQLIYNMTFVLALAAAGSMVYMNIILALDIPEHWCTVPGQEHTNYTLDEWRRITLPTQKDNRGTSKHSNCEMYNANFTEIDDWLHWNKTKSNVTGCQHGWSYDRTWYEATIPSKENWVCAKDLYVTNTFVVARVTEVIGSFVLGQTGDVFGRRIVYYISIAFCAVGRSCSIITTNIYYVFLFCTGLTGFAVNSLFQSPQIVGMEISREQDRSIIAIYQSVGWSIGTTLMPLLFWWLRDWATFMWLTTIPTAIVLIFFKYVIESPRWLISKHRYGEAITQFKKIARINGRQFDMTEKELAEMYTKRQADEPIYGMASLFSGWHLTRNTIIMGFSWCVVAASYFTLVLISTRMGGNPFLNFLLQSVVEIPAYMIGRYLGDTYGRRFTNSSSFIVSFFACIPLIILASDIKHEMTMVWLATFIKFLNAITFFTVNLQSMEIYPTCMRQTGIALGTILANAFGVLAPYLVYLGTTVDIRAPYYILGVLFFMGGIGALFLPETLHKKLPDTLEEARHFGKHDKFFSLPKAPPKVETTRPTAEEVHLNQSKFAP
ncbi:carcinine transporter [Zeugodacus cucurbitae]|uniref:Organic cation transporter 1 n=1 Tax=Zeugodacus cucurbitae TaxID=28588 RepID=A0A0A1WKV3_ZEUCU|nr:carcinine transporter [Zeugodacus cucurbitae]